MTEPPLIESERRALRDLLQLATDRAQAETEMEEEMVGIDIERAAENGGGLIEPASEVQDHLERRIEHR